MSATVLLVIALVVAILSVPTIGGLTAWGLAGGDGEADNIFMGLLAMMVGLIRSLGQDGASLIDNEEHIRRMIEREIADLS